VLPGASRSCACADPGLAHPLNGSGSYERDGIGQPKQIEDAFLLECADQAAESVMTTHTS
jgi:hypothetical protein